MAEVITTSIQKGGTGKSTSTGAIAYVLAEEYGFKTLVIDFDPQGNQTEMLTGCDTEEFEDRTILDAMVEGDPTPYILQITKNLYLIPADDNLSIFPRYICSRYYETDANGNVKLDKYGDIVFKPEANLVLRNTLKPIKDKFDFIFIDTPPMLSDFHGNALNASDSCIVLYQAHPFCYTAVRRFLETVKDCKEGSNPNLKLRGILPTMTDTRRSDVNAYLEMIYEKYGDMVFKTVIKHQATIGRLAVYGLDPGNRELKDALTQYRKFINELLDRIRKGIHFEVTEEMIARE